MVMSEKEDEFVSKREFHDILERLKSTEDLLQQLIGHVQKLDQRDENQDRLIQILVTQNKIHQEQIQELHNQLASQRRKTSVMEKIMRQNVLFKSHVNPAAETNDCGSATFGNEVENSGQAQHRIRRAIYQVSVAFTATVTNNIEHAGDHQIITFENVITNVGNAYNSHVGVFVAPISGIYVFSVTLFAYPSVTTFASVVKNGQDITWMYLDGVLGVGKSSQTIVLQLQKGDDVTIQHRGADKSIFGSNNTLFSGFLLQEDTSAPIVVGK